MAEFFGTFMGKQATRKKYVQITANDIVMARGAMFAHFGDKFMTVYTEEEFARQPALYGLTELLHIHVIDHGYGSVEYKLLTNGR